MWYQLRQFEPECRWLFKAHCEELAPAVLDLKFAVGAHCNRGMIQSAWWEATQNTYGALHCRKWEEIYPQERREWMIFD
ncbi:uncharacterized protein CTRU02_206171 [Colletotrichum truncatum]|uniref:Uncharacterized protein n=1 Tax=Colletotrichum truncatum TaxID=5467 RepID=A0ACC3Z636_COLTU|nr:uncharacterized protein CTRU02_10411 [Colletotrichum truncatum]KAF6787148.1 hypothetical protein CTRU02_10411 [Colletotrichum truncatum]